MADSEKGGKGDSGRTGKSSPAFGREAAAKAASRNKVTFNTTNPAGADYVPF